VGGGEPVEIRDHVLDPGLHDHFLAFQDSTQQQAYDDQHDRDLDERKALRFRMHAIAPC
jgi:hypothetical protein